MMLYSALKMVIYIVNEWSSPQLIYVIENGFSFIGELIIDGLVKGDFVIFLSLMDWSLAD